MLEVDGDEGQRRRDRNASFLKLLALPGLRGGVVDFKHAQVGMRVAVGEGVEAGAEDDVLGRSGG